MNNQGAAQKEIRHKSLRNRKIAYCREVYHTFYSDTNAPKNNTDDFGKFSVLIMVNILYHIYDAQNIVRYYIQDTTGFSRFLEIIFQSHVF